MFEAGAEGDRIALPVYAGAQMIQTSVENKYRFHMQVWARAMAGFGNSPALGELSGNADDRADVCAYSRPFT